MTFAFDDNDAFRSLTTARLLPQPPRHMAEGEDGLKGDHALQMGNQPPWHRQGKPTPAVVMVPILARPEPTVLFTVRATALRDHSGQVAFPGGKIDEGDTGAYDTALREAEEEIGLPRRNVELLGYLDFYLSGTNFLVTPVVTQVDPDFVIVPAPGEVEQTFEVPLAFLMDPARHELHSKVFNGVERHFYAIPYGEHYIWGVTAGIVQNLYERLYGS